MEVERAKGQNCFGTPSVAIMHCVMPVTVPHACSILPFSSDVWGTENSCLMPLDVHKSLNCFNLNPRAPSETKVPALPTSMMNRCNWGDLFLRLHWVYCPETAVTVNEAHCIAKTLVGLLLNRFEHFCMNDSQFCFHSNAPRLRNGCPFRLLAADDFFGARGIHAHDLSLQLCHIVPVVVPHHKMPVLVRVRYHCQ